jgi:hypothetical protein
MPTLGYYLKIGPQLLHFISMTLTRLTKMCLNEAYKKVHIKNIKAPPKTKVGMGGSYKH